ncbi:MAG: phosphoribosylglycinamide formyltransferase [Phycisphaerales bacterium]|nr:phosphoribosylglycinamide formyltransferase [Phycisphaerales bacterium]
MTASQAQPKRDPANLCVMISGGGRSLMNLADRIDDARLNARIALVIASRPCPGADKARERGLPVRIVEGRIPASRLESLLDDAGADLVVLAGYLQLVEIPERYRGKVLNIHPALLPSHGGPGMYGLRVHEAVLASGDRESGCTVHLCDAEYDRGPILVQKRCPVLPGDTPETLAARVFELEKDALPEGIERLLSGERP